MPRVKTNDTGYAYAIETSLGEAGTVWTQLEPNSIGRFGATITTVARSPISQSRQRRKGGVTDLESGVEFESDLTLSSFRDFIEGFVFAVGTQTAVSGIEPTGVDGTNDEYTIPAVTAATASRFVSGALYWASGFAVSGNNGLRSVAAAASAADTEIEVNESLTDEANPPDDAELSFAGYRIPAATAVTWTWAAASREATLGATGLGTTLGNLGLVVGQHVHVGSIANSDTDTVANAFQNTAANDMNGYARVKSVSADAVVFDKVAAALQATDSTSPTSPVDIVFGNFIRNVPTNNSNYLERSFHFEAEFPNLEAGGASGYQYSKGNFSNTAGFNLPLTEKATVSFTFVGTDTDNPTAVRAAGAGAAGSPKHTSPFNTSADVARLRVTDTDEDGITTDFKSLTVTFNNSVTPEKVLGTLGARYVNTGIYEVNIEGQVLFTDSRVIQAVRENQTVSMEVGIANQDGVIMIDIPSMTLGGGDREFPVNESVLINWTGEAFQDDALETSVGVNIIPVPLP